MKTICKILSAIIAALLCFNVTTSVSYAEAGIIPERFSLSSADNKKGSSAIETLKYSQIPVTEFRVSNLSPSIDTDMDYTDWWYSEWEDCRYIFLPSTADRTRLEISCKAEDETPVFLNGTKIHPGETTDLLSKADEFQVRVGEQDCGTLKIMQSNLGCVYLSTSRGSLDALDENFWLTESGSTLMLNSSGGIEYEGKLEKITAHGNSSWGYSKKNRIISNCPESMIFTAWEKQKNGGLSPIISIIQ